MNSIMYDQHVWCANYDWHISRVVVLSEGAVPPLLGVELSLARAKGWLQVDTFKWLCPECAARWLQERDDEPYNG